MKQVKKNPETPTNQHLPKFNSTFSKGIRYYINQVGNFFVAIPRKFINALSKGYKALFSKLNIDNEQPETKKNYSENTINKTRKRAADERKLQIVDNNNNNAITFMNDLHHKIAANDSAHTQENAQSDKTSEKDKISDFLDSIQETNHSGIDLKHDIFAALTPEDQHDLISALSKLEPPEQERLTRDVAEMLSTINQADINNGEEKENFLDTPLHELFRDGSIEKINQNYRRLLEYARYKNPQGQLPGDILKHRFVEIPSKLRVCNEDINQPRYSFHTPFHKLCRDGSIEEIKKKYPNYLKYATCKNLQGQLPGDILKSRFCRHGPPYELKDCIEAIDEQIESRYFKMENNLISFFSDEGCTEEFLNYFKNVKGLCYGLVYMRAQAFLDTSKDNTMSITQFDFIMNLLFRDFSSFPLLVKNNSGEEVRCDSLFKVVNTLNDESRLPLRAFLTELLSAHRSNKTLISDAFPDTKFKSQDMLKISEIYGKLDLFANTLFLGNETNLHVLFTLLFDKLKKMPKNSFLQLSNVGHAVGVYYDPKSDKLVYFDHNNLHYKNEQLAETFDNTSRLAEHVFTTLKDESEDVLFLKITIYTRPKTLEDQKGIQEKIQKLFERKCGHMRKEHYEKEKDSTSMQKMIISLLRNQSSVNLHKKNVRRLIRDNNNRENRHLVLRSAIKQNNKELVQLLANERDLLDIQNKKGKTVLFDAIKTGNPETVEILLEAGANVDLINKSLIDEIRLFGFSEIEQQRIKYLVLRSAIKQNNKELVQLLANERDLLDIQNEKGETVLFDAIETDNPETVEILLEAGASVDLIDKSLIDEVRSRGLSEIEQQLIAAKEGTIAT